MQDQAAGGRPDSLKCVLVCAANKRGAHSHGHRQAQTRTTWTPLQEPFSLTTQLCAVCKPHLHPFWLMAASRSSGIDFIAGVQPQEAVSFCYVISTTQEVIVLS